MLGPEADVGDGGGEKEIGGALALPERHAVGYCAAGDRCRHQWPYGNHLGLCFTGRVCSSNWCGIADAETQQY